MWNYLETLKFKTSDTSIDIIGYYSYSFGTTRFYISGKWTFILLWGVWMVYVGTHWMFCPISVSMPINPIVMLGVRLIE